MKHKLWAAIGVILYFLLWPAIWVYTKYSKPRARVVLVYKGTTLVVKNWLGAGSWALPGGGLEANEQPAAATVREIAEELDITLDTHQLIPLGQHIVKERGGLIGKYHLFGIELQQKPEIVPASAEIMDYDWLGFDTIESARSGVGNTVKQSVEAWIKR